MKTLLRAIIRYRRRRQVRALYFAFVEEVFVNRDYYAAKRIGLRL